MTDGWFTKEDLTDFVDELRRMVLESRSQYDQFDWAMGVARVVPSNQVVLPIHTYLTVQEITDGGVPDFQKPGMFRKFVIDVREFATALGITRQTIEDAEGWDPVRNLAVMAMLSMKKKKSDIIIAALMDSSILNSFKAPQYGYFDADATHDHWSTLGAAAFIDIAAIDAAIQNITQHGVAKPSVIVCNSSGVLSLLNLLSATGVTNYPATEFVIGGVKVMTRYEIRGLKVVENEAIPDGEFIVMDPAVRPVITRVKRDITLDTPPDDFGLTKSYYSLRMGALLAYPEAVVVIIEDTA